MTIVKDSLLSVARYVWGKSDRLIDQLTAELSSNRALLNWGYALAYLAIVFYCIQDSPESQNTAIVTTGGIVSVIFTSWVCAGSYESVARMRLEQQQKAEVQEPEIHEEEKGAGD
jgi:hypothetical protein